VVSTCGRLGTLRLVAALVTAVRKMPWARILIIGKWLYERAQDNLTKAEVRELGTLLKKTKGNPSNLSARERTRVRNLVYKGLTGRKP
jgi:hypothetical protein